MFITLLLLLSAVDARAPKIGDHVRIMVPNSLAPITYVGNITDISNGFVCLNCAYAKAGDTTVFYDPIDVCVGIGNIALPVFP
jgi:hypothetical protein